MAIGDPTGGEPLDAGHGEATGGGVPGGSGWDLRARLAWCRGFRHRLVERGDELCELMLEEVGKPVGEAWASDVFPVLAACRWHERHARRVLGGPRGRKIKGKPVLLVGQKHRELRVPLGHVAIIATWNYPVQLLGVQLIQAIVGGNRVTVKASEQSPRTQALLLEIAGKGLPEGVLESVGHDREAGAELLRDEPTGRIDHVVFTGSSGVGTGFAEVLAPRLVPSTLELSGRVSALVLADADAKLAADSLLAALRMNHGQTCMAPRRVLVVDAMWDDFVAALRAGLEKLEVEAGRGMQTGPGLERVRGLVDAARDDGAEVVEIGGSDRGCPLWVAIGAGPDSALAVEEHFGPAMAGVRVRDEAEASAVHARIDQHLATSVYSRESGVGARLAPLLGVGTVTVNDALVPQGHPGASIGGHRASGWGVSRGEAGLLAMTRGVHVSSSGARIRVPSDPIVGKELDQFRTVMRLLYGPRFGGGGGSGHKKNLNRPVDSGASGAARREHDAVTTRDGA